jgi:hypothetical protein
MPPKAEPVEMPVRRIARIDEILSEPGSRERKTSLGAALRAEGLDEPFCARFRRRMAEDLLECRKPDGMEKLRADFICEVERALEADPVGSDEAGVGIPVQLAFVHTVPRPERGAEDDAENLSWD